MSPLDVAAVVPDDEIAEKLRALRSPATYPVPAPQVDVIETHLAWVFLVGEHAYKLKKPPANSRTDSGVLRSLPGPITAVYESER
jgi:hypothetical protein